MLITKRLRLRNWEDKDFEPFAKLNADPRVMEFFPNIKTKEESDNSIHGFKQDLEKYGWGVWAAEYAETETFIGFIGLAHVTFQAPFVPTIEIGWRLAFDYWNQGLATEGAKACLKYGFETLNLSEIVSFTAKQNIRSRRVMEKIGMHHSPKEDFDHPKVPDSSPLKRHVLYRISKTFPFSKERFS